MIAPLLYRRAIDLGLQLEQRGDKLAVIPRAKCPADFAEELRRHKPELLAMLEGRRAKLPPDCWPWIDVAKQVLAGDFNNADSSTVESLTIGLRGIDHELCRKAFAKLPANKEKRRRLVDTVLFAIKPSNY
jgi:hypothetical protein